MAGAPTVNEILKTRFGREGFWPGQEEVIGRLLRGDSALAVFPTGAGKSLCYQLPALLLEGVTLVISPLIALMKDQVDALRERGIAAARLDSSLGADEARDVLRGLDRGELQILYVAPERLGNERFLQRLRGLRIALLAVDEAHCISEWGHNFRPDYLKIARLARELRVPRVLALTATATPPVAQDILKQFAIPDEGHVQTGFRRPNLRIEVHPCRREQRPARLVELLRHGTQGPSIVYVTHQRTAEIVAQHLQRAEIVAEAYHAGMKVEERTRVQEAFMGDAVRVVVATIAFGMGIDKPDIRTVYHLNLPKTLENYAQEIGRAGRDGRPSVCALLGCADDRIALENFTYGDTPLRESLASLLDELQSLGDAFDVSTYELSVRHDIRALVVSTALTYLELDGHLQSTGPLHAAYKVHFLKPEHEVLARFDARRQEFLRRLFAAGKMGRKWLQLDPQALSERLGEPRERLVTAITWLGEQGLLEVQPSGWRQGYRWLRRPEGPETLDHLGALFQRREEQDLIRLAGVIAFAEHGGCLTRRLLAYFGEDMDQDCGACTSCDAMGGGAPAPRELPRSPLAALGAAEENLVRTLCSEGHPALGHPRQIARFLCGLTSPAITRARLSRDPRFGALSEHPFGDVLDLARRTASG